MKSMYIIPMVIMLAVVMLISGCVGGVDEVAPAEEVAQAKDGDVVRVHYTGKTDDGAVFDSSLAQEPLQFTIGEGKLLARFEQAVIGMKPGESKSINIPADEAYGPYREDLVMVLDWSQLTEGVKPEVGQRLTSPQPDGRIIVVTVIEVSESGVTVDANHHLAKENLTFDIELIEIV